MSQRAQDAFQQEVEDAWEAVVMTLWEYAYFDGIGAREALWKLENEGWLLECGISRPAMIACEDRLNSILPNYKQRY